MYINLQILQPVALMLAGFFVRQRAAGPITKQMTNTLETHRKTLDDLDQQLVDLLAQRQSVIEQVAELKANRSGRVLDKGREHDLVSRLEKLADAADLPPSLIADIFDRLLEHSVRIQTQHDLLSRLRVNGEPLRVVYQGDTAAYSHIACQRHFSHLKDTPQFGGLSSFSDVMEAVRSGEAHLGMLPIENTTAGSINDTYDLLADQDVHIIGEEVVHVQHCLLGLEDIPLTELRRVYSHPQALAQCTDFLNTLTDCRKEAYLDTALAAKKVHDEGDPNQAAIASREAGETYGLHVLASDIANQSGNYTRFVVVANAPISVRKGIDCKTSLVFSVPDEQGALLRCLQVFSEEDLNLTKLESRPLPNSPWSYRFYADVEGNLDALPMHRALETLRKRAANVKVLGCYPASVARHEV